MLLERSPQSPFGLIGVTVRRLEPNLCLDPYCSFHYSQKLEQQVLKINIGVLKDRYFKKKVDTKKL